MGKDSKNFKTSEGYKCLKAAAEAKPDIPIIVVDRGAVEDKAPFLSLGVTDFVRGTLYKPQSDPMGESNPEGLALDREDLTAIFARQHFVKMAGELARERKRLACDAVYEYAEKEPGELEIRFTDLRVESAEEEDAESRRQNRKYLLAERPQVRVKDVFGNALVKEAAERCIDNIRNPEKYRNAEAKLMTGILMYGAPGMGKTMFAKAMAFEANASFISAVGADFLSGDGVLKMEEMFRTARRRSPCIFFIDEFDAISKDRGSYGMTSYQETVLDKFLKEMDGLETDNNGVYVVAATNYSLEDLDPAVTRRFSARIHVPYPTLEERQRFLLDLLEKKGLKDRISERAARTLSLMMSGKIRNYAEIKTFLEESSRMQYIKQDLRNLSLRSFCSTGCMPRRTGLSGRKRIWNSGQYLYAVKDAENPQIFGNLQKAFAAAREKGAKCRRFVSEEAAREYLGMLELKVFRQGDQRFCNLYEDALAEMAELALAEKEAAAQSTDKENREDRFVKELIVLKEGELVHCQAETDEAGVMRLAVLGRKEISWYQAKAAENGMSFAWYLMEGMAERFLEDHEKAYLVIQIYDRPLQEELLHYLNNLEYVSNRYRRNLGYTK